MSNIIMNLFIDYDSSKLFSTHVSVSCYHYGVCSLSCDLVSTSVLHIGSSDEMVVSTSPVLVW